MSERSRRRSPPRQKGQGRQRKVRVAAQARSSGFPVQWHRKALAERDAIDDLGERMAIRNVIDKLKVDGPALRAPHQSGVMGDAGEGLRELRPRRGRSRWRPIYRRIGEAFVILTVAPEAEIDQAGYDRLVGEAQERRRAVERVLAK